MSTPLGLNEAQIAQIVELVMQDKGVGDKICDMVTSRGWSYSSNITLIRLLVRNGYEDSARKLGDYIEGNW